MEMNFCRRCGTELKLIHGHVFKCKNAHTIFANCSPSTGIFLINDKDELLLAVRGIEPNKGKLDAFGGFLDGEELVEDAIKRELNEELGLKESEYDTPQLLGSGIGHYSHQDEVLPVLSILFWARLKTKRHLTPSDDVAEVHFTGIHDVDFSQLHDKDIGIGIRKLQQIFPRSL